ncbi:signal peptidase I [Candidatus Nitrosocosmicus hydrocola]|uniref:signal peptidase I n=1 Tax=Candidatus Nitrosocosmicus hydrocola TaxID=1826872 RepID=UPI000A5A512E|nr:signal peptidase I [Candidatus Nitrosocosmicus hydrocola]
MSKKNKDNKRKDIKIIIIIVVIFAIAFISIRTILSDSNPFYVVASGSMIPVLNVNDLIIVWAKDNNTSFASANIGDIIVFKAPDPSEENKTIVHRVSAIIENGNNLTGNVILCAPIAVNEVIQEKTILTKGDANECSIPGIDFPITQENYVGKVVYTIPQVGIIPQVLKPPVNYIIMAIIAGLLIFSFIHGSKKDKQEEKEKLKDE